MKSLLPMAANWPSMERWWGFRPCTPMRARCSDQDLWLGWVGNGHHRNGVLLAAITAQLVSGSWTRIRPTPCWSIPLVTTRSTHQLNACPEKGIQPHRPRVVVGMV